ncbi:MAG: hypothetical protein LAT67_05355 [Balneolales bacterium]|nr:hypothetical protein [Balneolales bacterium]
MLKSVNRISQLIFLIFLTITFSSCAQRGIPDASLQEVAGSSETIIADFSGFTLSQTDTVKHGRVFPTRGHKHIAVVFVRFEEDDNPLREWVEWPNEDPANVPQWMRDMVNSMDHSPDFDNGLYQNITSYFREASAGNLLVTGDVYYVTAPDSLHGSGPGLVNRTVLQQLFGNGDYIEPKVGPEQIRALDSWTTHAPFVHTNVPDGIADYIITIYRHPGGMAHPFNARWTGIAGLGGGNYPIGAGLSVHSSGTKVSGATMVFRDFLRMYDIMIHEVAHHLLGSPHPYIGNAGRHPAYWGLFSSHLSNQSINAYERMVLGWGMPQELLVDEDVNSSRVQRIRLGDYWSTGESAYFTMEDGSLLFFENRQKKSVREGIENSFDLATINTEDRGIQIFKVRPPYDFRRQNLRTFPADGHFSWDVVSLSDACRSSLPQPVLRKAHEHPAGISFRDSFRLNQDAFDVDVPETVSLYILDEFGSDRCTSFTSGEHFATAFGPGSLSGKRLFASYTNPASKTDTGLYTGISMFIESIDETDGSMNIAFSRDPFFTELGRALVIEQSFFITGDMIVPEGTEIHFTDAATIYVEENASIRIDGILLLSNGRALTGFFSGKDLIGLNNSPIRPLRNMSEKVSREPLD